MPPLELPGLERPANFGLPEGGFRILGEGLPEEIDKTLVAIPQRWESIRVLCLELGRIALGGGTVDHESQLD